jgi:hypothetical protein
VDNKKYKEKIMVDINQKEKERIAKSRKAYADKIEKSRKAYADRIEKTRKADADRIERVNEAYRQKRMKEDPVKYEKDMDEAFERVFGKGYKRKSKKTLIGR